jgi:hypothetical protein
MEWNGFLILYLFEEHEAAGIAMSVGYSLDYFCLATARSCNSFGQTRNLRLLIII